MTEEKKTLEINAKMSFKDILFHIRLHGYGYIGFSYSGGGDSGAIDEVYLVPKELAFQEEYGAITCNYSSWDLSKKCEHILPQDVIQIFEDKIYNYILENTPDWYNNDGGGGIGYICTENGDFCTDHYVNIIEREESQITGNLFE